MGNHDRGDGPRGVTDHVDGRGEPALHHLPAGAHPPPAGSTARTAPAPHRSTRDTWSVDLSAGEGAGVTLVSGAARLDPAGVFLAPLEGGREDGAAGSGSTGADPGRGGAGTGATRSGRTGSGGTTAAPTAGTAVPTGLLTLPVQRLNGSTRRVDSTVVGVVPGRQHGHGGRARARRRRQLVGMDPDRRRAVGQAASTRGRGAEPAGAHRPAGRGRRRTGRTGGARRHADRTPPVPADHPGAEPDNDIRRSDADRHHPGRRQPDQLPGRRQHDTDRHPVGRTHDRPDHDRRRRRLHDGDQHAVPLARPRPDRGTPR